MKRSTNLKCPKCGSSLFHVIEVGSQKIVVCYRTKSCNTEYGLVMQ